MTMPTRPFRVLATCGVFEPGFRGGGPIRSVAHIVDTVPEDVQVLMVTRDRDLGSSEPYPGISGRWVDRARSRVFYLDPTRPRQLLRLWRALRTTPFDLLYVNSLWSMFSVVPIVAVRFGLIRARAVLVAPRGELFPGALALKARKKRLFLTWWARFLRKTMVVWHASDPQEAAHIRTVCPWARVEVNGNQTPLPREPVPPLPAPQRRLRLVFLSRICAKKNLDLVLSALRPLSTPVELDIYGPIEDAGYWARCQAAIRELPATTMVTYRGEVAPENVRRTFAGYDAFVFPTLGENFGHVIAESLSASCPVLCSDRTPWSEVLAGGGGAVFGSLTAGDVGAAIRRLAELDPAGRLAARERAGAAYRSWRAGAPGVNIIEQARVASWLADRPARTSSRSSRAG